MIARQVRSVPKFVGFSQSEAARQLSKVIQGKSSSVQMTGLWMARTHQLAVAGSDGKVHHNLNMAV